MDRALKILSALFATASLLTFGCIVFAVLRGVVPNFAELQGDHRKAALVGLGFGYLTMFALIYAQAARLIWRRVEFKKTIFLAAASCLGFPVGPMLGIAALVLLTRHGVRQTFRS
ncbi:MAG: hypothetical protein ACREKL_14325 [Chthoniobacterales bacterium]